MLRHNVPIMLSMVLAVLAAGMAPPQQQTLPPGQQVVADDGGSEFEDGNGAIVGRVLGDTGGGRPEPIAGAVVTLLHRDRVILRVRTNAEGQYAMRDVRAGDYGMTAQARGFEPGHARVTVVQGHRTQQDFLLLPAPDPGAVVGQVLGDTGGRHGEPLRGAGVALLHNGRVVGHARTNEEGFYAITDVRPGEYGIVARAEGFEPQRARVLVESGHRTQQDFLLDPAPDPGAVAGQVLGDTGGGHGRPLAGAIVALIHNDRVIRHVRTNEEGHYEITDVRPGDYGVAARAEGFEPGRARVTVVSGHRTQQDFLLSAAAHGGAIAGTVMGETRGGRPMPIEGALVTLLHEGRTVREVRTNSEGRYGMRDIRAGEYSMTAEARGFLTGGARGVVVEAGQITRQSFLLEPGREPAPIPAPVPSP